MQRFDNDRAGDLSVARRPTIRDRLIARLHAHPLDEALASGIEPEATPALALRARRLTGSHHRRLMADGYRRVPREADGRLDGVSAELARLADTLAEPGPVAAEGAAQAWLLLTDGTGPLHNSPDAGGLRADAVRTLDNLRLAA